MLALIKIRTKYLSQHACGVYWGYLFIPSMILFSLLNVGLMPREEIKDGNIITCKNNKILCILSINKNQYNIIQNIDMKKNFIPFKVLELSNN